MYSKDVKMNNISVIVPFYNPPRARLRLCLDSLINQMGVNYEIILVDDGSTIDLDYLINTYKERCNNLRVIKKEHQGVGSARNLGLNQAKGDYIVFCDADDYVDTNYLLLLKNGILDADLAICGVKEQFFPVIDSYVDKHVFYSFPSIYNQIQYVNFSVNKIFKTELLNKYNIRFDETVALGEDALFIAQYLKHCQYIRTISNEAYHYLPNLKSAVHSYKDKYWNWESNVIQEQVKQFTQYPLNEAEEKYMCYWIFNKIRGAVNYYAENVKNTAVLKKKLHEINNSSAFIYLNSFHDFNMNPFFKTKEKCLVRVWKNLGLYWGIKLKMGIQLLNKFIR